MVTPPPSHFSEVLFFSLDQSALCCDFRMCVYVMIFATKERVCCEFWDKSAYFVVFATKMRICCDFHVIFRYFKLMASLSTHFVISKNVIWPISGQFHLFWGLCTAFMRISPNSRLLVSNLSLTGLASFPRQNVQDYLPLHCSRHFPPKPFERGAFETRKFFFSSSDKIWKGRGWLWSKEDWLSGRFRQIWPLAKVQIDSMCLLSFRALDNTGDQWPTVITINTE